MPLFVRAVVPLLRRPVHRENFFLRPDELFRIAMTLDAPLHIQRSYLISQRHQVNAPVTGRAPDALVHMNAVIEISEVGQVVHARPLDRLPRSPAFAHRLEVGAVRPNLRVTIHACFRRRYAGKSQLLDGRMTVAAIDGIIADVVLVAELNGLLTREVSLSVVRGPVEYEQKPDDYSNEEDRSEDGNLRDEVRASIKDLAHRPLSSERCQKLRTTASRKICAVCIFRITARGSQGVRSCVGESANNQRRLQFARSA